MVNNVQSDKQIDVLSKFAKCIQKYIEYYSSVKRGLHDQNSVQTDKQNDLLANLFSFPFFIKIASRARQC